MVENIRAKSKRSVDDSWEGRAVNEKLTVEAIGAVDMVPDKLAEDRVKLGAVFVGEVHQLLPGGVKSDAVPANVVEVFLSRREVW